MLVAYCFASFSWQLEQSGGGNLASWTISLTPVWQSTQSSELWMDLWKLLVGKTGRGTFWPLTMRLLCGSVWQSRQSVLESLLVSAAARPMADRAKTNIEHRTPDAEDRMDRRTRLK